MLMKSEMHKLEKQVATLRSSNSAMRANMQQAQPGLGTTAQQFGVHIGTDADHASSPALLSNEHIMKLQQKVQLQGVELKSLAKALTEKVKELSDLKELPTKAAATPTNSVGPEDVVVCYLCPQQYAVSHSLG
jgi:DNA-binding protein H-NS